MYHKHSHQIRHFVSSDLTQCIRLLWRSCCQSKTRVDQLTLFLSQSASGILSSHVVCLNGVYVFNSHDTHTHTHTHTHTRSGRSSVHKSRRLVAVNHISTCCGAAGRFALWSVDSDAVCLCVCSRVSSARTWFLRSASTCARSPRETSPSRSGGHCLLRWIK